MNKAVFFVVFFLFVTFAVIFISSGKNSKEIREENIINVQRWMQEMKVEGTASCNHSNPFVCEAHPKDRWPPVLLYCHDNMCELNGS